MKKLITIVLLAALSLPAIAQVNEVHEQKWTVKASAGYIPSVPYVASIFGAIFIGIAVAANEEANETLAIDIPPYCSLEALYSFNERWSVGLNTGYAGCAWKIVDKDTREVKSSTCLNLIPVTAVGRCNYLYRPAVKLYGSLELGAFLTVGGDFQAIPNIQFNPIGIEFGRRFFGLVELGIGMNYTGLKGGIGYRF